jgi:hypothetical protein
MRHRLLPRLAAATASVSALDRHIDIHDNYRRQPMSKPAPLSRASAPEAADESLAPTPATTLTDVAYIGGAGRSGSTVLALLLGQVPGFLPVGGVNNLWERGLLQNYLCGCGAHFRDCPFWDEVGREAFGGWDAVDPDEVVRLKSTITRYRHLPWHLAPGRRPAFQKALVSYSDYLAPLYAAIKSVSRCTMIVDNSHDAMCALVLHRTPGVEAKILHLVRDSRGVAFSLSKRVLRAEETTTPTYMPRYSSAKASVEWLAGNLPFHAIRKSSLPYLRIHYESLVASPATEIARIVEFLGSKLSPAEALIFEADSVAISDNHMVSGNPHRLGRETVQMRLDDEWRTGMRTTDRTIVTLLTSPLGLAYGYMAPRVRRTPARPSPTRSV